jgi:hypothetical protein
MPQVKVLSGRKKVRKITKYKVVFNALIVIAIIIGLTVFSGSCKKLAKPKALISVIDTAGLPVAGATVKVFSSPNGSVISQEKLSDASGQASFEFELECILTVKAEKKIGTYIAEGKGLVILKQDETYEEQITLK